MSQRLPRGSGPSGPEPDPRTARITLAVAALAVLAVFLDTTVLFVAFPRIVASFPGTSATDLSWVLNAYTIVYAALLVPAGKLSDRFGHKRTFLWGSFLFTVTSLLCGLAPTAPVLIVVRALQAIGGALLIPASLALVIRATPRHDLPVSVAIWGAVGAVSGAVGPTLGAGLISIAGWRGVFFLNIPVGIVTLAIGGRVLRESVTPGARTPAVSGILLVAGGAALTSLGFVQSETWGWTDLRTLSAVGLGALTLVAFGVSQTRASAPVVEPSLFAHPTFLWVNLAAIPFGLGFTGMFLGSILYLTQVWGWSTLGAGLGVAPGPALVAVTAPLLGRLARRVGQKPLILLGGVVFALGGLFRWWMLDAVPDYFADYLPGMILSSLGVALCIPQMSSAIAQSLPPSHLGVGTATNQAIRQFSGTFGVALTVAFVSGVSSTAALVAGFDRTWLMTFLAGALTTVLALPIRRAPPLLPSPAHG